MSKEKVTIGICDDESFFVEQIKFCCESYLEEIFDDYEFVIMNSGEDVINYHGEVLDILFLDIELGDVNGIEVMKTIMHNPKVWRIVFVSTHEELVWDTFSIKTLGFCKKPVDETEISKYIQCALSELRKDVRIIFKRNDTDTYIRLSDLYYIEGKESYVKVYTKNKDFIATGKIGNWEKKLIDTQIVRIHKSFMVNMEHIRLEGTKIQISDIGKELPVGRTYKNKVKEEYDQYVWESMRNRSGFAYREF